MAMAVTQLPPQEVKDASAVLAPIQAWEHWNTIKLVAQKEYGMSPEEFDRYLPEYQRFLGLIRAGYAHMGMFSENVDKIWHSHVLHTTLYIPFSELLFGRIIHHVPNLEGGKQDCVSPDPCASKCLSICKTPPPSCTSEHHPGTVGAFIEAYTSLYGEPPSSCWNLPVADGTSN